MSISISMIAAHDEKRGIGKNNELLWHIPEDLQHFKKITAGNAVIMGRKTYESIGRPLPNRTNIVVSTNPQDPREGLVWVRSLTNALAYAAKDQEKKLFIIGGASIYQQALQYTETLYLTIVRGQYEADTYFPAYEQEFLCTDRQESSNGHYHYSFTIWKRARS